MIRQSELAIGTFPAGIGVIPMRAGSLIFLFRMTFSHMYVQCFRGFIRFLALTKIRAVKQLYLVNIFNMFLHISSRYIDIAILTTHDDGLLLTQRLNRHLVARMCT